MSSTMAEPTLDVVKCILILDNDGRRVITRYYDGSLPTLKEQKTFEKDLFKKTHKVNGDIVMFEGLTCVYRSQVDLYFYVIGSANENELLLMSVLNCVHESISQLLKKNVERRALLDKIDSVFLAIDEICDGGIILEADSSVVVSRCAARQDTDIPLGEQTVAQVLDMAKEQIGWSLFR